MKKVFVSLLLLMLASAAWAIEVTFVPMGVANVAQSFSIEKDGVKLNITQGIDNGSQFRIYKGQQLIITSEVGSITKIVIECIASGNAQYGPGNFVSEPPGYSYIDDDNIGIWQGSSPQVIFTAVGNQVRVTKITVMIDEGLTVPVIRPASGTYYEPIEVTMSCYTQGATIHYTTNGSTPTINSTQYTSPITLTTDATVKAVAVLDGEVSDVVAATYQFIEPNTMNCFEDLEDIPDGTLIRFTAPVYALAQFNNYLFVKDQCDGYALIYGNTGQTYTNGDVIPEGFVTTKATYNGEPEFTTPTNFKPATGKVYIEPEEITGNQVGHDLFGHYVVLRNVTIVQEGNTYYVIDENGNVVAVYFGSLGVPAPANLNTPYDLYAIVGSYGRENTIYQLLPLKLVTLKRYTLCDLFDLPDEEVITFDHEATVLYQFNNSLYLKDGDCYGLAYGYTGQTYETGDIIPAGWGGIKETWYGEPELKNLTGFLPSVKSENIEPEEIGILDVGHNTWAHYVLLKQVRIDTGSKVIIDQDGNECLYHPQSPYIVESDQYIDLIGIVTSYGRNDPIYEILIITSPCTIPPPPRVCCFRDLLQFPASETVEFECPITVIYQNGANLYAIDSCGDYGLIYGNIGGPFENGDQIIGMASWKTYSGNVQLIPSGDWTKTGHIAPVEPIELYVDELDQDMCHQYIRFEDVKIIFDEDGNARIEDETGILLLFDKFHIDITPGGGSSHYVICDVNWDNEVNIADINALIDYITSHSATCGPSRLSRDDIDPDATYDVEGFLTIYRGELELFPTKVSRHGGFIPPFDRWDVNGDDEVTIADINCIIDFILSHKN